MLSERKKRLITPNVYVLLWVIRNYVEKEPQKALQRDSEAFSLERRDAIKALEYLDAMFTGNRRLIGCGGWPKQKFQEYSKFQRIIGCGTWPKQSPK
jgi:hypothetical protein